MYSIVLKNNGVERGKVVGLLATHVKLWGSTADSHLGGGLWWTVSGRRAGIVNIAFQKTSRGPERICCDGRLQAAKGRKLQTVQTRRNAASRRGVEEVLVTFSPVRNVRRVVEGWGGHGAAFVLDLRGGKSGQRLKGGSSECCGCRAAQYGVHNCIN